MFFAVCMESNTSLSFFLSMTMFVGGMFQIGTYIHAVTIEHRTDRLYYHGHKGLHYAEYHISCKER